MAMRERGRMRDRGKPNVEPGMVTVETAIAQGPLWMGLILALVPLIMVMQLMGVNHLARDVAREVAIHGTSGGLASVERAREFGAEISISRNDDVVEVTVTKDSPRLLDLMGIELKGTQRVLTEPSR